SAAMATLAVLALYAAARATGVGVVLAWIGTVSFALDGALKHSARILDPDAATTGWISLLLLALLLLHRWTGWSVVAGVSLGMACLTRYNAALALILVAPFLLERPRRIVPFVAGGMPFVAVLLAVNSRSYGHPFWFPYLKYAAVQIAGAQPYSTELGAYLRAFVADHSPVLWLPFLAFPFLPALPRWQRIGLSFFV